MIGVSIAERTVERLKQSVNDFQPESGSPRCGLSQIEQIVLSLWKNMDARTEILDLEPDLCLREPLRRQDDGFLVRRNTMCVFDEVDHDLQSQRGIDEKVGALVIDTDVNSP